MAMNPYDLYKMQGNCKKVIVEASGSAVGTVVDIMVDSFNKVERITESVCETIKKDSDVASIPDFTASPAKNKTLSDLFEEELSETFRPTESGDGMYAGISIEADGMKQQYLVFISTGDDAEVPIKVIPIVPSGVELFGFSKRKPFKKASSFDVRPDRDNPGEVYLETMHMRRIIQKYKPGEIWSRSDVKDYFQEIEDWTKKMSPQRKEALERKSHHKRTKLSGRSRNRFDYLKGSCKKCRRIVISDRAYMSIIAEALSRDPDETGGILLGIIDKDTWYVVEATDPGLSTFHNRVHHEMDEKYHNHVYRVISRLYEKDLCLLGLWHRHPGTLNTFSSDDNRTNTSYSEAIGNGTLSFLLNFVPDAQLTCYYLDDKGTGSYYKPNVRIGDKYFKGTDYLVLADEKTLIARKKQMQREIKEVG